VDSAVPASALSWLAAQRDRFVPEPGSKLGPAETKPVTELALMLCCLQRQGVTDPSQQAAVNLLTGTAATVAARAVASPRQLVSPSDVVLHATMCCALSQHGTASERHRDLVSRAVRAGVLEHSERLTYHMMEERLVLDWCGIQHGLPSWQEFIGRSMLRHRLLATRLTERASYQLTHDIMFLAGFDRMPGVVLDLLDRPNLQTVLADLIVRFASEAHWDLLGELLLCWDCLRLPQSDRVYRSGWALLLAQQSSDGSLPGPPSPKNAPVDTAADGERFANRYHTTLVAILALAAQEKRQELAAEPGWTPFGTRAELVPGGWVAAVRTDIAWLDRQQRRLPQPGKTAAAACGVLVGTWLCAAIDPDIEDRYSAVAERTAALMNQADTAAGMPPALALTAYALLAQQGLHVPPLSRFTKQIQAVLALYSPSTAESDVWLAEKRVILHQLEFGEPAPRVSETYLSQSWRSLPLRVNIEQLQLAALVGESATSHGTIHVPMSAHTEDLSRVILAHAGRLLRDSDLHTACFLLRAAHHVHPLSESRVAEFAGEIVLHQRSAGGYGLVDLTDQLAKLEGDQPAIDPDFDLRLPTTLSCLWTLAELLTDFRLYQSITTPISAPGLAASGQRR
jgi:hypothetical protein